MTANTPDFNISVTFRHTESTPALKAYAIEKVTHCLQKYVSTHADVQIILQIEKRDHQAEVNVHSKDYEVSGHAVTDDLYSAIDKVIDTIETQLRKQKERLRSHKHAAARAVDVP
ncbi:MAG: ribosome-associated translation inhibitor RaiA [Bdellovibrionota bacterium]